MESDPLMSEASSVLQTLGRLEGMMSSLMHQMSLDRAQTAKNHEATSERVNEVEKRVGVLEKADARRHGGFMATKLFVGLVCTTLGGVLMLIATMVASSIHIGFSGGTP